MRFLFGCIDVKQNAFLKRAEFVTLIEHMSYNTSQNPNLWILKVSAWF